MPRDTVGDPVCPHPPAASGCRPLTSSRPVIPVRPLVATDTCPPFRAKAVVPLRRQLGRRPSCRCTLAAPTALATSIRPPSATTATTNYSDVGSAIAPIYYDLNSAIRYTSIRPLAPTARTSQRRLRPGARPGYPSRLPGRSPRHLRRTVLHRRRCCPRRFRG